MKYLRSTNAYGATKQPKVRTKGELWSKAAKLYEGFLIAAGLLVCALVMVACASTDPLTVSNLEHAYEVWRSDHKPVVTDEAWIESSDADKLLTMPESESAARRYFFENAIEYEESKGSED